MAAPLLPLLGLGGLLWFLDREKERELSAQPVFTAHALAEISELREGARHFRQSVVDVIAPLFAVQGLERAEIVEGEFPGALFRLVPLAQGAVSAKAVLEEAKGRGWIALGSLSVALIGSREDKLLWFVPPAYRSLAGPASQFAVIQDVVATEAAAPVVVDAPVVETPPDPPAKPKRIRNGIVRPAAEASPRAAEEANDVG